MALAPESESRHGMWSSRWLFVLAAAGSAVGIGNIWKFPYVAGQNGGGAFVLIYLVCVAVVGIPIMMSEVMMGREGRHSPINTMRSLVERSEANGLWVLIGWMGVLAGFLILSYYAVIAGWAMNYVWLTATGTFESVNAQGASNTFDAFLTQPLQLIFWQTIFMALTVWIVGKGVTKGLETAIRVFMPILFILLITLLVYSVNSGGFEQGWDFMFNVDASAFTNPQIWLLAMGQSFFTLSLGMGAMMAYGAYVPENAGIGGMVVTIAALDTVVAIAAGLAIFPIVFANGLDAAQGPGLMFVTIPLAFGQFPLGAVFGSLFFILVTFAALTSAISLTEPALAYLVEEYNAKRPRVAISLGVICWILGLGTVFSFNVWSDVTVVGGLTIFDFVDYVSQNIMLPLGGLLIAVFGVWVLPKLILRKQLGLRSRTSMSLWKIVGGIIAPLGVLAVFINILLPIIEGLFG